MTAWSNAPPTAGPRSTQRDLIAWWLHRYPGPGGATSYWASLAPLADQATAATAEAPGPVAVSGDLAADLLAPWRRPRQVVVYAAQPPALTDRGFVPATSVEDASLVLTAPQDRGVWLPAPWPLGEDQLPSADPLQVLYDIGRSGGPDAPDAAEHLTEALLGRLADAWREAVSDEAPRAALELARRGRRLPGVVRHRQHHRRAGRGLPHRRRPDDLAARRRLRRPRCPRKRHRRRRPRRRTRSRGRPPTATAPGHRGYRPHGASNRFARKTQAGHHAVIDVLAPSHDGRLHSNRRHGALYLDEIPGLLLALARPSVPLSLEILLQSGQTLRITVQPPDPLAALALKAVAYVSRRADKDALDVWRLLAVCHAAGIGPDDWGSGSGIRGDAAAVLRAEFGGLTSPGLRAITSDRGVHTRVRALVQAVVGQTRPNSQ